MNGRFAISAALLVILIGCSGSVSGGASATSTSTDDIEDIDDIATDTATDVASGDTDSSIADSDASVQPTTIHGVYDGNDPDDVLAYETWLGKQTEGILGYTGDASWADYDGSVGWAIGVWKTIDRPVLWSIPLIPSGATLAAAANGDYDDHYTNAAKQLAEFRPDDERIYIRTAWEFNGDWFPWTAHGKAADFVGAFRHFVNAFRAQSDRFVIEWNVACGTNGMSNLEDAYPGDDYVDLIGMDFYWYPQWSSTDPEKAFAFYRDTDFGLAWHQDFAATHGKRTTYSEWGINQDSASAYIDLVKAWFEAHDVVYATYWDSNAAYSGKLSDGQYPTAGATYRADFAP